MDTILHFAEQYKFILGIVALFGIELSPIKINPLQWIGDILNKSIKEELEHVKKEVENIKYQNDMKDLSDVRNRILAMDRLKREGMSLTRDDISSVGHDVDRYNYLKEKYVYMEVSGKKVKINGEIENAVKNLLR